MTHTPSNRKKLRKKVFPFLARLALCFLVVELACFAGYMACCRFFPSVVAEAGVDSFFARLKSDDLGSIAAHYDPLLGWDLQPGLQREETNSAGSNYTVRTNADRSRVDRLHTGKPCIVVYGDSFAQGVEVNGDETWASLLEAELQQDVRNFGVHGYSPLQAVLKYQRHIEAGLAPALAILTVYEENMDRLVNANRFFIGGMMHPLSFSPCLEPARGTVRFHGNVLHTDFGDSFDRRDLKRAVGRSADIDFWAGFKLRAGFPYSFGLARCVVHHVRYGRAARGFNLWQTPEGAMAMDDVLDRYLETSQRRGITPVVLFIPDVQRWKDGRRQPQYTNYARGLKTRKPSLTVVDIAEAEFEPARFNVSRFKGHASVYGNRVIASHLTPRIKAALALDPEAGRGQDESKR
ncbi:MAG: SGNH/GDSL hydrolase family protein [Verrucomicrobia bacterium]|nr:SGNH/GDSL hydrolase family protein [Verrucomicrobiota bacterium]